MTSRTPSSPIRAAPIRAAPITAKRRKGTSRRGDYRAQFGSAWARDCAEGVTPSQQALANHVTPPAPLLEALGAIKAAAAAAPGEWQAWYWICIGGVIVFIATIFVMRGRWSPAAARADEAAHDAAVARELHALQGS